MLEIKSNFTTLLLGGCVVGFFYFLVQGFITAARRREIISSHGCKSPKKLPVWDPVLGLDSIYETLQAHKRKTLRSSKRLSHEKYGLTHSSRIATSSTIHTIESENIKAVMATNFKDFEVGTPRRRAFSPVVSNSVLMADGAEWEHLRAFLRPSFTRSQVGDLETLEIHVKHLIDVIPQDGSTVDLAGLFFRYSADVVTDLMFGESILSLSDPEAFAADLSEACRIAQLGVERRFILGAFANFVPQREFYRAIGKIHSYVNSHVDKAIQQRQSHKSAEKDDVNDHGKYVFLRELVKVTDDRAILQGQLLGIFFAGRDTTAALLSNLFFALARNPDVWQRLREEIGSLLQGREPSLDELKKMKYLSFCLNESQTLPTHLHTLALQVSYFIFILTHTRDCCSTSIISRSNRSHPDCNQRCCSA